MNDYEYLSPDFWKNAWNAYSSRNKIGAAFRNPKIWDKMAAGYNSRESDAGERKVREDELVEMLAGKGILKEGARILDLGCGPGNYSIEFAKRGADVVALDISQGMIEKLKSQIPETLSGKVQPIMADWGELDLATNGFEHQFDLVFARMTPACNTPDQFEKILRASKGWCYFAAWVGERQDNPMDDLWLHLTGSKRDKTNSQFFLILNMLFTLGMYPDVRFFPVEWGKSETIEDVANLHAEFFSGYLGASKDSLYKQISDYLTAIAVNGMVPEHKTGTIGQMLWKVRQ
ncbi:MAG: class I SAM-dependent methyltransferase [Chlorobiales bacterium]|nr:class I SAM-dependent methyltransferase [Chlorobiales bacterium]